jgi:hypothetical protein
VVVVVGGTVEAGTVDVVVVAVVMVVAAASTVVLDSGSASMRPHVAKAAPPTATPTTKTTRSLRDRDTRTEG